MDNESEVKSEGEVAVLSDVWNCTDAAPTLLERVTLNIKSVVPEFPSDFAISFIVTVEAISSFVIVPTPCGTIMLHPTQFDKLTLNVSSSSIVESATTVSYTHLTLPTILLV